MRRTLAFALSITAIALGLGFALLLAIVPATPSTCARA